MSPGRTKAKLVKPEMIQRHGGGLDDVERFFAAEHRYFDDLVDVLKYFRLDAFDFAANDESNLFRGVKTWQFHGY